MSTIYDVNIEDKKGFVIAVISDTHTNSTVGLVPPVFQLDDGGYIYASSLQTDLWKCYLDFCEEVDRRAKGKRKIVVWNGDIVDREHHRSIQFLTKNTTSAVMMSREVLSHSAKGAFKKYMTRGTEAHAGESSQTEELLGGMMQTEKEESTNRYSRENLWMVANGVPLHFTHHGKMGAKDWTQANALLVEAHEVEVFCLRRNIPVPVLSVRGHNHRFADSGRNGPCQVLGSGCWQLKSSWFNQVKPVSYPGIGGTIIEIDKSGRLYWEFIKYNEDGDRYG